MQLLVVMASHVVIVIKLVNTVQLGVFIFQVLRIPVSDLGALHVGRFISRISILQL